MTLPNAVPPRRSTGRRRHCAPQVLFVGALDYAPNRDAAAWLLRDLWPRLRRRRPGAKLVLVGRGGGNRLRQMARARRAVLIENLNDLSIAYRDTTVTVVPVRAGGGTRIKILESGAFGIPCISFRKGAEGLSGLVGPGLILADDPGMFVEHSLRLLASAATARHLGRDLQRRVRRLYDRGAVIARVASEMRAICDRVGRPGGKGQP